MKTIHIDDILRKHKKKLLSPGPGRYKSPINFGKKGKFISLHKKLPYDNIYFKRQKNLPGPQ